MVKPACHFDLVVEDSTSQKAFYQYVFEWEFDAPEENHQFISGLYSPQASGGMYLKDTPPRLILCIHVASVTNTLNKVKDKLPNGFRLGPLSHPLGGKYGVFMDPENILMGCYEGPLRTP